MSTEDDTRKIVLDCIRRLTNEEGAVSYQLIIEQTGLSPHVVKERCDQLVNVTKEVIRPGRGMYKAVKIFPPSRPISKTALTDGEVILEVGDVVLHLTPAEERMMRGMFGNATVELQQVAAPVTPMPAPMPSRATAHGISIMTIDDIAETCLVGRRYARDHIIKRPGFPPRIPGSSHKKPMWLTSAVRDYLSQTSRTED